MGRTAVLPLFVLCAGSACSAILGDQTQQQDNPDAAAQRDAPKPIDAPPGLGAWSTPQAVPGASSTANLEDDVTLSSSALELIYAVQVPGSPKDLYVMTRTSTATPWSTPSPLPFNTAAATEESPRLSANDLTLYFGRGGNIYSATRASVTSPWGAEALVTGNGDTAQYEKWLAVCGTNHFMVSRDNAAAGQGQDLY